MQVCRVFQGAFQSVFPGGFLCSFQGILVHYCTYCKYCSNSVVSFVVVFYQLRGRKIHLVFVKIKENHLC